MGLYKKYGRFVRVGSSDLMVVHPLGVPAIHGSTSKCRKAYWHDEDWPRRSIYTSRDHEFHGERRRLWSQSFRDKALRGYERRIALYNKTLIDRLGEHGGQPINAAKLTLQSDCKTIIVGGSDTVAASLSHIFSLLTKHLGHVDKLRQQLLPLMNSNGTSSLNSSATASM